MRNNMTIKQEAAAYREAMKTATIAYKDEDKHLKATLERIFPQLKESENRKIKKEIIRIVEIWTNNAPVVNGIPRKNLLAWVEKQDNEKSKQKEYDAFIDKACEWLRENIYNRVYKCGNDLGFPTAEFLKDFKNYMKEN